MVDLNEYRAGMWAAYENVVARLRAMARDPHMAILLGSDALRIAADTLEAETAKPGQNH